ncbi:MULTISPECIES: lysophospholipid acyltransferase family protein [Thiomicrorhabdus]|uniref:1-acyl-sn-glycerol-3-phosphate acyltransferase n=1 Tax=Thiomicrorhabdus heinhorstiae TaxID=2748010 RepID=A0ABS0BWY3_9GAMM|nr:MULTISPECIES: lysophospholipid acyltransferase family protein [Thiomicrorhabdus]MBF6058317.1 1-acyl-sn-glycerol-3-phosphate acyltransferase [Thiomicrorhabdus heinhorstiae]
MQLIWFLRSCLFAVGQLTSLVFFSVLGQFTRPFSFKVRYDVMHYWAVFCVWWLKLTCGLRYQVHGAEHINKNQAAVIMARHESAWETLVFQQIFPRQAYVLKRELLRIPFFGWGMALLHPIAIDRGAGRQALKQLVSEGSARIKSGDWVVVFPEGTRMAPNELGKINVGGAMMASQAKATVYLVAHNAGSYWPKNSFIKRPGSIDVYISEPLNAGEMSVAELNRATEEWFKKHL